MLGFRTTVTAAIVGIALVLGASGQTKPPRAQGADSGANARSGAIAGSGHAGTAARRGTSIDSLRFRVHVAQALGVHPASVDAIVAGEHGTSQVFLWSSARVAGAPVAEALGRQGEAFDTFRNRIENDVRFANITIIGAMTPASTVSAWCRRALRKPLSEMSTWS